MHLILSCPPGLPTVWAHQRTAEGKTVTFWALCVCVSVSVSVCVCVCVLPSVNCLYSSHVLPGQWIPEGSCWTEALLWITHLGEEGEGCPVIKLFQKYWTHQNVNCLFPAEFLERFTLLMYIMTFQTEKYVVFLQFRWMGPSLGVLSGTRVLENAALKHHRSNPLSPYLTSHSVLRSASRSPHPHTLIPAAAAWLGCLGLNLHPKFYSTRSPGLVWPSPVWLLHLPLRSCKTISFPLVLFQNENEYFWRAMCTAGESQGWGHTELDTTEVT